MVGTNIGASEASGKIRQALTDSCRRGDAREANGDAAVLELEAMRVSANNRRKDNLTGGDKVARSVVPESRTLAAPDARAKQAVTPGMHGGFREGELRRALADSAR